MTNNPRNLVGPAIRKLRYQAGLSQPQLSARCSRWGWNLSRETLAKIETQLRWVSDFELLCLALALRVEVAELLPKREKTVALLSDFFGRLGRSQDLN
jgi:transcriptional regulator with XRE-family HTH domain